MGSIGPRDKSALIKVAEEGAAKICAVFGGQGSNNLQCFNDLVGLNTIYGPELRTLIQIAASTLSELASIPHTSGFHNDLGFRIQEWLANPSSVPSCEHMALSPISFPINTLLSLAHYCITCRILRKDPGQLRSCLQSVIGHSQGLFAAAAVAKSDSWQSFYDASAMALRISFWVGLESHDAAPPSTIGAVAAQDCIEHGEGQPSPMLNISGLTRLQVTSILDKVNKSIPREENWAHLALVNSRDKHVLAGSLKSLRAVCLQIREIRAADDQDQSRIIFHKRKPQVDVRFLPISAPYHSPCLDRVDISVSKALSSMFLTGRELGVPIYHTKTGKNFQDWRSEDVLKDLIRAVTVDMVDWSKICMNLEATHLLDFGPGQVGSLAQETAEGTGLRVILMTDRSSSSKKSGTHLELFSAEMPPPAPSWKQMFSPRLVSSPDGVLKLETKMTRLFGTPPIMVAGMTPTTVSWEFVGTVMQAGYHIELAGGGYSQEKKFEDAIRNLASVTQTYRGITCNLLYVNPKTIAWQTALLRDLVQEGIAIDGITIGAGVPSPDVVKEYIETIGLKHISFKPGSYTAIHEVIDIARRSPNFPIGLQWTGGRAGGHHSFEDFHLPILKSYGRIRECPNIVLIAGSGFGGGSDTFPYLSGEWAHSFGYPSMPFDGVLLGSRMMVAKEARTSIQAKKLIIETEGVGDSDWYRSLDMPTGGVITINSEMGQPIHMLATRGVMLWKEFDHRIFSIKDREKRLKYLRLNRDEIVSRLNNDYSRPWFAVNKLGQNVEIEDLTYVEVLRLLCQLMYIAHQDRWIDASYLIVVRDFLLLAQERFGHQIDTVAEKPSQLISSFEKACGSDGNKILYPEDVALLLSTFRRRGQKPVPFIPKLDENFETWFKKDSLWQSEDIDAVVGQDVQRVCVIQGPVAVRYSTSCEESAKDILDSICQQHVQMLRQNQESTTCSLEPSVSLEDSLSRFPAIKVTNCLSRRRYELSEGKLPVTDLLIEHIVGASASWARSCLMDRWIFRGLSRTENTIRAAFKPQVGDVVEVRLTKDCLPLEIVFKPGSLNRESNLRSSLQIVLHGSRFVKVTITPPPFLGVKGAGMQFTFELHEDPEGYRLIDQTGDHAKRVQNLYAQLWACTPLDSLRIAGLNSEFSGEERVLSEPAVQEYMKTIRRTTPPQMQAWNPTASVPLDYCVVVAWKALIKPLLISAVDCDLLRLLHKSISFKYLPTARQLEFGDVVRTVSRITALTIKPTGKLIEISADIRRGCETVVTVKSEFFIRGKSVNFETQFKSLEEPVMILDVRSEVLQALLLSRKWIMFKDPSADLVGKRLLFRLANHMIFDQDGNMALLQVAGTVSIEGQDTSPSQVYFEEDFCTGNPVMDFLHRHGARRVIRQVLESPGWTDGSTTFVRAPPRSESYSKVSLDLNPIHICPIFARYAGLSGTVVHGMHVSAVVRRIVEWAVGDTDRSRFKGWQVNFENMVRHNDLLRVELQHIAMEEGRMIFKVQAFNDKTGDKVVEAEAEIEQERTGYVFCGQGSQEQGMGMSLYATRPEAKELWDRGETYLREHYGFSILQIVRENPQTVTVQFGGRRGRRIRNNYLTMTKKFTASGSNVKDEPILKGLTPKSASYTFSYPKGLLLSTQFSQPALALMEMVEYEHLKAKGVVQSGAQFAGHSLGEYAALGACTTFMSFENLLTLIFYRGLKMQKALQRDVQGRTDYSMMATDPSRVGKEFDERSFQNVVTLIGQETKLLLEVVNHNVRSQQYVCAGHFRSLWILSKVCDELSSHPQPHTMGKCDLLGVIRNHIPASEQLSNTVTLERGKATIPLSGIDIPFHSTMLRGQIMQYREYLLSKLKVEDVKLEEFVGRWTPNVVGRPFSLQREYVELVHRITGSEEMRRLVGAMDV